MLERRLCVYNAGLKVDASREILTVVMTSYYENVCSCKRHTVVRRVFCFGDSLCSFLALRLTTVSLDYAILLQAHAHLDYNIKGVSLVQPTLFKK